MEMHVEPRNHHVRISNPFFARQTNGHFDSWETYQPIAPSILKQLGAAPYIKLDLIYSTLRPDHVRMDKTALSSRLLHALNFTVFAEQLIPHTRSEFLALKECLIEGENLRDLTLHIRRMSQPSPDYTAGALNLQLEKSDIFPALERLVLDCHDIYELSAEHCQIWTHTMDWGRLRELDLGHGAPQHLLFALTGKVVALKRLRFGFWRNYGRVRVTWNDPKDLNVVRLFLESVDALENVTLYTGDDSAMKQVRPTLLRKHGASLKRLIVWLGMRESWSVKDVSALRQYAPCLQELDVPVDMYQERKHSTLWVLATGLREGLAQVKGLERLQPDYTRAYERSRWPTKAQKILCSFRELRSLTIRIQLKYDSYQFVPDARPGLRSAINDESARKTAIALFDDFAPGSKIEVVRIIFRAREPGAVEWTYMVERRWMAEKNEYGVVVDRVVKGEEYEEQTWNEPFDPFA